MGYVIGCDLGSQSVKAVLAGEDGSVRGTVAAPLEIRNRHAAWADQDPRDWLTAVGSAVRSVRAEAGIGADAVEAIGFASQVDGVVAVDAANRPLAHAIIWMDRRATQEAEQLVAAVGGDEIFRITGLNADAYHVAPKIAWLRANDEDARDADAYLLPGSFLAAYATGRRVVDHANASSTMLYDVHRRAWSADLLAAADLDVGRLAPIAEAADVAERLTPGVADELGLTTGCVVAVGTGDEHGACLGAGALGRGVICDISGTAEPVAAAADAVIVDETRLVETHAHAIADTWLIENPGFVSGGSTRWLAALLGVDQEQLADLAESAPPGARGVTFLPALSGSVTPRWNAAARGVFSGLSLLHSAPDLARALYEGCCYALRDIVERLDALGLGGELRVVGGGARSVFWLQLKADVTGRPVRRVQTDEATAMGAAMLAAVAAGWHPTIQDGAERYVRLAPRVVEPTADPAARDAYAAGYQSYRNLFDAVEPMFGGGA